MKTHEHASCHDEASHEVRERLEAELTRLREALRAVDGLLAEMHPHVQRHSQESCTGRTDFCIVSLEVARALASPVEETP
jgi:hypothetical protein